MGSVRASANRVVLTQCGLSAKEKVILVAHKDVRAAPARPAEVGTQSTVGFVGVLKTTTTGVRTNA